MSEYPPVLVTACSDPEQGKANQDIFEQPFVPDLITGPHHIPASALLAAVALLSTHDCVETKTYRTTLCNAQTPDSQAAMQQ
jgi:hypothetical protein